MYFADEIREPKGIKPDVKKSDVDKREVEMAQALIDKLYGEFKPEQYEDTYRETLCEIIKAKRAGETIEEPQAEKPKAAPDLMEALKASLEQADDGKKKAKSSNGGAKKKSGSKKKAKAKA
jgi:DNA end-binding protein Ku